LLLLWCLWLMIRPGRKETPLSPWKFYHRPKNLGLNSLVVVCLEECLQSVRNDGLGSFFYHDTQWVPITYIQRKKLIWRGGNIPAGYQRKNPT
jgi:hypothetical protein